MYFMPEVKTLSLNEEQMQLFHLIYLSAIVRKQLSLTSMALRWHLCLLHLRNKPLSSLFPS